VSVSASQNFSFANVKLCRRSTSGCCRRHRPLRPSGQGCRQVPRHVIALPTATDGWTRTVARPRPRLVPSRNVLSCSVCLSHLFPHAFVISPPPSSPLSPLVVFLRVQRTFSSNQQARSTGDHPPTGVGIFGQTFTMLPVCR